MFPKRRKILLSSLILALLPILSKGFAQWWQLQLSLSLGVPYILTLFVLDFDLRFPEHLIFPIYPLLSSLGLAFWSPLPGVSSANLLLVTCYLLLVTPFYYLLFLSLNILNVATVRVVPLKQVASSVLNFLGLVLGLGLFWRLFQKGPFSLLPIVGVEGILAGLLGLPLLWDAESEGHFPLLPLLTLGLVGAELAFVTSFWPTSTFVRAVMVGGGVFVLIGLFQHRLRRELARKIWIQYLAIGLLLITSFLLNRID